MFEKVNPKHPDKIADRIAGAIVDNAYARRKDPKIAVEVLIGHGKCLIIMETNVAIYPKDIYNIVERIAGPNIEVDWIINSQDEHLAKNQENKIRCGDNGIFKGALTTDEQKKLVKIASELYEKYDSDGKYIIDEDKLIICQSKAENELGEEYPGATINPLGYWTGGLDVDCGATNRKLGSDMGDAVTGGGLHGKDLSKADVSINIFLHVYAHAKGEPIECSCAIGDEHIYVDGKKYPYSDAVKWARAYIKKIGGFEKLAEWGLIRP